MSRQAEGNISDQIIKTLNKHPYAKFIKNHGSAFTIVGEPDISGCICGQHVVIETKADGEEPRKIQYKRLREWERAGSIAIWATSVEEVVEKLKAKGINIKIGG